MSDTDYLSGLLDLWNADKNPLWIWCTVKTCIANGDPFPADVIAYLNAVADRLLSDKTACGDFGRVLPRVFGFKPSGKRHPLRAARRMVEDEKFAVKFMVGIFAGLKPAKARSGAGNVNADDKTLQRKLKAFFRLKRLPSENAAWRKIVIRWMVENWNCRAQYPQLPVLTRDLIAELA